RGDEDVQPDRGRRLRHGPGDRLRERPAGGVRPAAVRDRLRSRETGMENGESAKRPHARLEVWRDAMDLVECVYRFSGSLPDSERFGLTSQLRRAAVSVPSNIAEGAARRSTQEYIRFL